MNEQPTPETDAVIAGIIERCKPYTAYIYTALADHARKLERERDAARAELDEAKRMRPTHGDMKKVQEDNDTLRAELSAAQRERDEAQERPDGYQSSSGSESTADLIAPWIDKPVVDWSKMAAWHRFVAMDFGGAWRTYSSLPVVSEVGNVWIANNGNDLGQCVPPAHCPQWTGDWRDSLVERPD
jgi:hypothetical protein